MRLRIKRDHMSQPDGGWSYRIGDDVLLEDTKVDGLVRKIAVYRRNNSIAIGDPEHDLALSMADKVPWLVISEDKEPLDGDESVEEIFIRQAWRLQPIVLASRETAEERFKICRNCPMFSDFSSTNQNDIRRVAIMSQHLNSMLAKPSEFGFCLHHLWVCSVAACLRDVKELASPERCVQCWVDDNKNLSPEPGHKAQG